MQEVKFRLKRRKHRASSPQVESLIQVKPTKTVSLMGLAWSRLAVSKHRLPVGPEKPEEGRACRSKEMTQMEPLLPAKLVAGTANPHPQQNPSATSFPRHRQLCTGVPKLQMFPISNGPGVWGGYKCARAEGLLVGYLVTAWGILCFYGCT